MKKNTIGILITGSEVLDGRVHDSNSYWMISLLADAGFVVEHVLSCDDTLPAIKECLSFLLNRVESVIVSGGLGPTTDDLTREAISELLGLKLIEDKKALASLTSFFEKRNRPCHPANLKQALLPEGARIIENELGTAPGFYLQQQWQDKGTRHIVSLPGVPFELHKMFAESVLPLFKNEVFKLGAQECGLQKKVMRVFGVPESVIGAAVVESKPAEGIVVSYRAAYTEVQVILKPSSSGLTQEELNSSYERAKLAIGKDCIFSESLDMGLERVVHELMLQRKLTLSVAESCTGGLLGSLITDNAGSSKYFMGGCITYSNQAKIDLLSVSAETLASCGAVSAEVACQMAQGARRRFGTDLAISITGIAGPDGGSVAKPVGTFFVGLAHADNVQAYKGFQGGIRERIRRYAAYRALDIIRRALCSLPLA